jgi:hypothetical protein
MRKDWPFHYSRSADLRGLVTYYVLFFIHLDSRRVSVAGITDHPEACGMRQVACNATLEGMEHLNGCRYVLHDRCQVLRCIPRDRGGMKGLWLPPRSPDWNAFAERWVRSVQEECPSYRILFGERSLRKALISSKSIITRNATIKARTTFWSPGSATFPASQVASRCAAAVQHVQTNSNWGQSRCSAILCVSRARGSPSVNQRFEMFDQFLSVSSYGMCEKKLRPPRLLQINI